MKEPKTKKRISILMELINRIASQFLTKKFLNETRNRDGYIVYNAEENALQFIQENDVVVQLIRHKMEVVNDIPTPEEIQNHKNNGKDQQRKSV